MTGCPRGKQWAVVQDLRPFGIKIWSRHWTRWGAERRVGSEFTTVMRVEDAEALDREVFRQSRRPAVG